MINKADSYDINHKANGVPISQLRELEQEMQELIEVIASCTTHQKRITDDILSLSKLDSNLLEICPSLFDIRKFLNQLNLTFAAEAERAQVKVATLYKPRMRDVQWIEADPGRLMQVLINLVANAIKFTKDQDSPRTVTISMSISENVPTEMFQNFIMASNAGASNGKSSESSNDMVYLSFEVRDTGCGMDSEAKSRIFSRFAQASPKTYSTYGGSGLGLFVSQKLVVLQHGDIGFTSEAGKGSAFAFYVRAVKRPRPVVDDDTTMLDSLEVPTDGVSKPEMLPQGFSMLLVEDNIVNRKVLKKQLQQKGFTVHTAEHGKAALDFMASTRHWVSGGKDFTHQDETRPKIDLILMDVEMPVMNGLDCAAAIRLAEREGRLDCHIPIIAITANARIEQLQTARDAGMNDALSKPFHVHDLLRMIVRLRRKLAS